jgi:hypothetical protein
MSKIVHIAAFFLILAFFFSCKPMAYGILGIRDIKTKTEEEKTRFLNKLDVPSEAVFEYNTRYLRETDTISTINDSKLKYFIQPLQLQFFDATGTSVLHYKNCDVPGIINLKWNHYGIFDSLPPKYQLRFYNDSIHSLESQFQFITPLGAANTAYLTEYSDYDYTLVVVWTMWMHRQSKRLIRDVLEFKSRYPDKKLKVVFINFDNYFVTGSN